MLGSSLHIPREQGSPIWPGSSPIFQKHGNSLYIPLFCSRFPCSRVPLNYKYIPLILVFPEVLREHDWISGSIGKSEEKIGGSSLGIFSFYLLLNTTLSVLLFRPLKRPEIVASWFYHTPRGIRTSKSEHRQTVPREPSWWDWIKQSIPSESRERLGEGVPGQIAGTYRFSGNSPGIPREYATKVGMLCYWLDQSTKGCTLSW